MLNYGKCILSVLALSAASLAAVNGLSRCEECLSLKGMACGEFAAQGCACQSQHADGETEYAGQHATDICFHDDCSHVFPLAPTIHAPTKHELSAYALFATRTGFAKPICSTAWHSRSRIAWERTPKGSSPPTVLRC